MIKLEKRYGDNNTIIIAKLIIKGNRSFTIDQFNKACNEFKAPEQMKQEVNEAYTKHIENYDEQKELEEITNDAEASYLYAKHILKNNPFPQGEKAIATNDKYSYWYARFIIEAPFPLGEASIATDSYHSFLYAKTVLKASFPKGEAAIATDEENLKKYTQFLKGLAYKIKASKGEC